jgi:ATP-dependent RNA helicase RhlE
MARGVDVLVATPGRLLDHIGERNINLTGTEILVLDEADRMLDLGFLPPIRRIVSHMSARRQNLFFSATMPQEIAMLADEMLRNPVRVAVSPTASTVDTVKQHVLHVESHNKRALLVELFADPSMSRILVFTRTKRGADRVARHLEAAGIRVATIHGNKSQSQREQALAAFRASKIRVLVATDIAARGIDIDQVTHVVNYELPDVAESYVHRIGRTARAGAHGVAISLCDADEREQLRDIERLTRQSIPAEDRRDKAARHSGRPTQGKNGKSIGFRPASGPSRRRTSHAERRQGRIARHPTAA